MCVPTALALLSHRLPGHRLAQQQQLWSRTARSLHGDGKYDGEIQMDNKKSLLSNRSSFFFFL